MIFKRHITTYLDEWRVRTNRKPLILRGARQVGKTTLVQQFAQQYKYSIFLNLEKQADWRLFEEQDDVKNLVDILLLSNNITASDIDSTILFIDEIQESPKAIRLLRYFHEEMPELHVIAAGSLLEFAMRKVKSFPVGRVEFLYLYPLNFAEYLEAIGHDAALAELQRIPLRPLVHTTLLDLFHQYAIVGGMPEIVQTFILNKNVSDLPVIYQSIWATYLNDIEKYATNATERKVIKHIMATAHLYLDQRIKFQNFGNSNYRSREVGEAMHNLDSAKIIQLVYPTTNVNVPVKPDIKKSPRLQFLDTGLINHVLGIQAQMIGIQDLSQISGTFRGAVISHLITQELLSLNTISDNKPLFWVREKAQSSAEVDLVYTCGDKVIPIEIKSGVTGTLKSLHQFVERTNHPYAVRIYAAEFKIEKARTPAGIPYILMHLPYYLGTKIPEYITWFVEEYRSDA